MKLDPGIAVPTFSLHCRDWNNPCQKQPVALGWVALCCVVLGRSEADAQILFGGGVHERAENDGDGSMEFRRGDLEL